VVRNTAGNADDKDSDSWLAHMFIDESWRQHNKSSYIETLLPKRNAGKMVKSRI